MYNIIGFTLAGLFVMSVWKELAHELGILGGIIASGTIIGLFWNINHKHQLIKNNQNKTFIDMAIAIAIAGIVRDSKIYHINGLINSLPTFCILLFGGIIGGVLAHHKIDK